MKSDGNGIKNPYFLSLSLVFSPHTRGVIQSGQGGTGWQSLFPAHAGGDPTTVTRWLTRADFSPHTRG